MKRSALPKVNFIWSFIYQETAHLDSSHKYDRSKAYAHVVKFLDKVERKWRPLETRILSFMSKATGISWGEGKIDCYVLKSSRHPPISDPMTIPIEIKAKGGTKRLSADDFIDSLVHELIHRLYMHDTSLNLYFSYLITKKYRRFSWNTAIHVPVHALHKAIYLRFFSRARLDKDIKFCNSLPEYRKSWQLVTKEGSDALLSELRYWQKNEKGNKGNWH